MPLFLDSIIAAKSAVPLDCWRGQKLADVFHWLSEREAFIKEKAG